MEQYVINEANMFMGENAYEQYQINESSIADLVDEKEEAEDEKLEVVVVDDDAELESGEDYTEEETEEEELISKEDIVKAIQLVIDGEAETAEEAIEIAQAEEEAPEEEVASGEEVEDDTITFREFLDSYDDDEDMTSDELDALIDDEVGHDEDDTDILDRGKRVGIDVDDISDGIPDHDVLLDPSEYRDDDEEPETEEQLKARKRDMRMSNRIKLEKRKLDSSIANYAEDLERMANDAGVDVYSDMEGYLEEFSDRRDTLDFDSENEYGDQDDDGYGLEDYDFVDRYKSEILSKIADAQPEY